MKNSGHELTAEQYKRTPGYTPPLHWERDALDNVAFELRIFLNTGHEMIHADAELGYYVLARGGLTVKLYYDACGKRILGYSLFPNGTRTDGGYTRRKRTEQILAELHYGTRTDGGR